MSLSVTKSGAAVAMRLTGKRGGDTRIMIFLAPMLFLSTVSKAGQTGILFARSAFSSVP